MDNELIEKVAYAIFLATFHDPHEVSKWDTMSPIRKKATWYKKAEAAIGIIQEHNAA